MLTICLAPPNIFAAPPQALEKLRRTAASEAEQTTSAQERDAEVRRRHVEDIAALRERNMTLRKELTIGEKAAAASRAAVASSAEKLEAAERKVRASFLLSAPFFFVCSFILVFALYSFVCSPQVDELESRIAALTKEQKQLESDCATWKVRVCFFLYSPFSFSCLARSLARLVFS